MNDQVMVDPRVKIGVYIYVYIADLVDPRVKIGGSNSLNWCL